MTCTPPEFYIRFLALDGRMTAPPKSSRVDIEAKKIGQPTMGWVLVVHVE
jgi:hypothetical protein